MEEKQNKEKSFDFLANQLVNSDENNFSKKDIENILENKSRINFEKNSNEMMTIDKINFNLMTASLKIEEMLEEQKTTNRLLGDLVDILEIWSKK